MTLLKTIVGEAIKSALWDEDEHIRIAWITLIAMADDAGEVEITTLGLSRLGNLDIDDAISAMQVLLGETADGDRTDGKMYVARLHGCRYRIDGFDKIVDMVKLGGARASNREAQARYRESKKGVV